MKAELIYRAVGATEAVAEMAAAIAAALDEPHVVNMARVILLGGDELNDTKVQAARHDILEVLADRPWQLTKTAVRDRIGGNRRTFDLAFDTLIEDNRITHDKRGVNESGATKSRVVWAHTPNPDQLAAVPVHRYGDD